jgi:hypothetical protein
VLAITPSAAYGVTRIEDDDQREAHPMSDTTPIPTSRTYIHNRCNGGTVVSGGDFQTLANPFAFSSGTMCVTCNKGVPLKDVAWADTGEPIATYRRRLRAAAPATQKLFAWLLGPAVFGLVGAGIGLLIKPGQASAIFAGFFGGALIFVTVLMPLLTPLLFKIDYRAFE